MPATRKAASLVDAMTSVTATPTPRTDGLQKGAVAGGLGGEWAGWGWGGGDVHDADAGADTDTSPAVIATTAATATTTAAVLLRPALRTSLSGGLSTGFEVTGLSHEHDMAGDRTTGCYAADGSRRNGEPELVGGKGCHDGGWGDTESLMC